MLRCRCAHLAPTNDTGWCNILWSSAMTSCACFAPSSTSRTFQSYQSFKVKSCKTISAPVIWKRAWKKFIPMQKYFHSQLKQLKDGATRWNRRTKLLNKRIKAFGPGYTLLLRKSRPPRGMLRGLQQKQLNMCTSFAQSLSCSFKGVPPYHAHSWVQLVRLMHRCCINRDADSQTSKHT